MDRLREVLALIQSGKSGFTSESESEDDIRAFQPIAKCLIHAKNEGLIEACMHTKEGFTGDELYNDFFVRGGLTYKGEQFLNSNVISREKSILIQELVMGDKFEKIHESTIINRSSVKDSFKTETANEKTLFETVTEIQRLLKQLEQTNPTATEPEQVAYINIATNSDLKQRAIAALKAGGETAFDEYVLESKWLKVVKSIAKGWLQSND